MDPVHDLVQRLHQHISKAEGDLGHLQALAACLLMYMGVLRLTLHSGQ